MAFVRLSCPFWQLPDQYAQVCSTTFTSYVFSLQKIELVSKVWHTHKQKHRARWLCKIHLCSCKAGVVRHRCFYMHVLVNLWKQEHCAAQGCVLTFGAEATQGLSFGGSDVGQPQRALVKILVGEQVSQTHSGGVASYVWAELLRDTRTIIRVVHVKIMSKFYLDEKTTLLIWTRILLYLEMKIFVTLSLKSWITSVSCKSTKMITQTANKLVFEMRPSDKSTLL